MAMSSTTLTCNPPAGHNTSNIGDDVAGTDDDAPGEMDALEAALDDVSLAESIASLQQHDIDNVEELLTT